MPQPKKLIEVAMPIKEISAESVRDKSIRHGHISTLHLWWARRPLPVCRGVVFASLVPDPLDENCPQVFRDAVQLLLGAERNPGDPYKPYGDIPYTAAVDEMEDNLRNRLLMFIGKFSNDFVSNEKSGKVTPSGKQLSDFSLIKWDNKNNDQIIGKARRLIWVAHNATSSKNAAQLLEGFDSAYGAIEKAEQALYATPDRHIESVEVHGKERSLHDAIEAFLDKMPKVFDPFAGGGAIPLEAARLGCRSFGNDINPVAHIIQKGSLEFPQLFGKPITYSRSEFIKIYGQTEWNRLPNESLVFKNGEPNAVNIANRLSFDLQYYSSKLLNQTEKEIGHLYPIDEKGNRPIAYYWARIGICSNPSCRAEVPLIKNFYLSNGKTKKIYIDPKVEGRRIDFKISHGECHSEGFVQNRKSLKCPCCGNTTSNSDLKSQFLNRKVKERLIAVIIESKSGKEYRLPTEEEIRILEDVNVVNDLKDLLPIGNTKQFDLCGWGFTEYGSMFTNRQFLVLDTLTKQVKIIGDTFDFKDDGYKKAILSYLGILINRIASRSTSFGIWNTVAETLEHPFGRQAIAMVFDFPESNPFTSSTGGASNQLEWIIRYIETECKNVFSVRLNNATSGDKSQFSEKSLTAVVTDPPYYDAIAYADLSDFFYAWLKRTLATEYPLNFATPQTPKSDECTALRYQHGGSVEKANNHFENKLLEIFDAIEHQTSDIVSIMYAHQSTAAWTTLCNSILGARMNITGSWAIDTERTSGTKTDKAFLSSSVTVACRPQHRTGLGDFKEVKKAIETTVAKEVDELYSLGFRGADLLTACFGQAVSEFGKYEKVEKADGSEVTVADLLEMARESAFNALLKGFEGDDFTKFYIGWLQLYGFAESDFDDAAKFSRVGLSINVGDLFTEHILIKHGNKQTLGTFEERASNKNLGTRANNFLIDEVHRAMALYKGTNRNLLLQYVSKVASQPEGSFWRVVTSLCEILPAGSDDHKQALGLLTNKDSLIRESKTIKTETASQANLFEQ